MLHRSLRGSLRALTPLARAEHAPPTPPPLPTTCAPAPAPPCPACEPQPRPACRAAPAARSRALRVTCCPPPTGMRPPCAAPPPPCSLTCANFASHQPTSSRTLQATQMTASMETEDLATCGIERDIVAQRLAAAECIRRASYLREVAERPSGRRDSVPPAPYRLDTERECACATDGRVYAIADADGRGSRAGRAGTGCGPDRTPPPPRCLELVPDNECQITTGDGIDPCSYRPRIFMDIDRSGQKTEKISKNRSRTKTDQAKTLAAEKAACIARSKQPKCPVTSQTRPPAGLASRIMNSLSLGRGTSSASTPTSGLGSSGSGAASCPGRACDARCKQAPGTARRAGDSGWCASPPAPAPAPPRCRPPSLAERLRRRKGPCSTSRRFHTAVSLFAECAEAPKRDIKDIVTETKANAEKLSSVLKEREALAEAGRGRVASGGGGGAARPAGGNLDMPVPAGAARLRVRVELDGGSACAPRCPAPAPVCPSKAPSQPNKCARITKSSSWPFFDAFRRKKSCSKLEFTLMAMSCGSDKLYSTSPCGPSTTATPSPCPHSPGPIAQSCSYGTSCGKKDKKSGSGSNSGTCSCGPSCGTKDKKCGSGSNAGPCSCGPSSGKMDKKGSKAGPCSCGPSCGTKDKKCGSRPNAGPCSCGPNSGKMDKKGSKTGPCACGPSCGTKDKKCGSGPNAGPCSCGPSSGKMHKKALNTGPCSCGPSCGKMNQKGSNGGPCSCGPSCGKNDKKCESGPKTKRSSSEKSGCKKEKSSGKKGKKSDRKKQPLGDSGKGGDAGWCAAPCRPPPCAAPPPRAPCDPTPTRCSPLDALAQFIFVHT